MQIETTPAVEKKSGGGKYAGATFFLVGATSTLTQVIAAASLGYMVAPEWSSGGVVALVAAIWMWIKCRSWASWRKWVWLPTIITVVLAFVTVNLTVTSLQNDAARAAHEAMCTDAENDVLALIATQEQLLDDAWAYSQKTGERPEGWVPTYATKPTGTGTSWRDVLRDAGATVAGRDPYEVWDYYVSYNGPALETDVAQAMDAFPAECLPE